jgi:anti-sigma regulatory factor (Ser/Thr protein kinase)/DNA-binding XRE family transcriptional regulator
MTQAGPDTAQQPIQCTSQVFPAHPRHVREARTFLAALLDGCPVADDALLCLSELATNAITHSRSREPGGQFTVRVRRHGTGLRAEVGDQGGPWTPHPLTDPAEQSGRGLAIVDRLARTWGRGGGETGWTLWFEIGQPPARRWITSLDSGKLRQARRHHGLTQAELAAKAGISTATITRLETSTCPGCRCRTLARLATALDTDPTALTASSPPPTPPGTGTTGDPRSNPPPPTTSPSLSSPTTPAPGNGWRTGTA